MKKLSLLILLCLSSLSFGETPRVRLAKTLNLIEKGNFVEGSKQLYILSRKKAFRNKRVQIKYTLGIAFVEMRLYHMASIQFISVIKSKDKYYRKKAIEKLVAIGDFLEDKDFIYYILDKIKIRDFPVAQREKLYFYFGLLEFKKKRYSKSRSYFSRVGSRSPFYNRAQYQIALSYAEGNQPLKAALIFNRLANTRQGVTDQIRVAAKMGEARAFYQAKKFRKSLQTYRSIPRDTKYWHEALLESSWAYLRSARFRSALSNFQTLHSSFYENFYQPESLILRAYVYLYICKYYEMEKVLDLFKAFYLPILRSVKKNAGNLKDFNFHLNRILQSASLQGGGKNALLSSSLPSIIVRRIEDHSEFQNIKSYLGKLHEEQNRFNSMPYHWISSRVGRNTGAIIKSRIKAMKKRAGILVRTLLLEVKEELERLTEQEQYLRYDMLRGKREIVKKRIQRKRTGSFQIDERISRDYYIKNGYEYWPFKGENWLDELGNYHYIGLQNCN